ncbi:MAG TPA: hypothetical protein VHX64_15375, partial [Caulobacteraceae bacterium]|nr:hypothetical protein [Caulobacteraceae bacterium]
MNDRWASKGAALAAACVALAGAGLARAAGYPTMAPVGAYLMADRATEIALARTAAPSSVSRDAEVMVLGPKGYVTGAKG